MEIHAPAKMQGVTYVLETMEVPENSHVGIRVLPLKKVAGSIAQLNCIYTNAHSMGNKQEELVTTVQQENHDTVASMDLFQPKEF